MAKKLRVPKRRKARVPAHAAVASHRRRAYEPRHRYEPPAKNRETYHGRHRADDPNRYVRPTVRGPYGRRSTAADDRRDGYGGSYYFSENARRR